MLFSGIDLQRRTTAETAAGKLQIRSTDASDQSENHRRRRIHFVIEVLSEWRIFLGSGGGAGSLVDVEYASDDLHQDSDFYNEQLCEFVQRGKFSKARCTASQMQRLRHRPAD
jgi:hypothetical protein